MPSRLAARTNALLRRTKMSCEEELVRCASIRLRISVRSSGFGGVDGLQGLFSIKSELYDDIVSKEVRTPFSFPVKCSAIMDTRVVSSCKELHARGILHPSRYPHNRLNVSTSKRVRLVRGFPSPLPPSHPQSVQYPYQTNIDNDTQQCTPTHTNYSILMQTPHGRSKQSASTAAAAATTPPPAVAHQPTPTHPPPQPARRPASPGRGAAQLLQPHRPRQQHLRPLQRRQRCPLLQPRRRRIPRRAVLVPERPGHGHARDHELDDKRVLEWVGQLMLPDQREMALLELSKKREQFPELALILWHSLASWPRCCRKSYPSIRCSIPVNSRQSASNPHIPLFLYPFLNTTSKSRPFEYLRLTSLGVHRRPGEERLIRRDQFPPHHRDHSPLPAHNGDGQRALKDCRNLHRAEDPPRRHGARVHLPDVRALFYAVGSVLSSMVMHLVDTQNGPLAQARRALLLRLSDNVRAREALRQCLPEPLRDATFSSVLRDDAATKRCLAQLLINLVSARGTTPRRARQRARVAR
ncbi:hypothetical protein MRB53_040402 [Persea americana]|nr:hypothetical protein MRB53_040402 [Persea americana]